MDMQTVSVVEVIGSAHCISSRDGEKVHAIVAAALRTGMPVQLSFAGADGLSTAFLNAAIGQLYGEMDAQVIGRGLFIADADNEHLHLIERVVERANAYFIEPARFDAATAEAFGD
jgi:hypothetical protein